MRSARPLRVAAPVLLLASAAPALAQLPRPLVPDRPDFTESAVTVGPGRVQVEAGYTFTREGEVRTHTLGEVLVRVGLVPGLELRLGPGSFAVTDAPSGAVRGFEDISLGGKAALLEGSRALHPLRPSAALVVGASLPTGSAGLRGEGPRPEAHLALSWELPGGLSLGSNVGVASVRAGGGRYAELSGSLVLGVAWDGGLGGFVEVFGFRSRGPGGPDAAYLDGGVTLLVHGDLQLDARVGVALAGADPGGFAGVGFAVRR